MNKTHGLQQMVDLKASVNWGLNDVLKTAFPNTIPVMRPLVAQREIHPQWLAGFATVLLLFVLKKVILY